MGRGASYFNNTPRPTFPMKKYLVERIVPTKWPLKLSILHAKRGAIPKLCGKRKSDFVLDDVTE